jgi:hypothetical protein
MQRQAIPGASLALARNGALVLAIGYGWADREARVPVTPNTLFALASVSKSLTAVTILKLVDAGRLSLDARVFELLSDIEPLPGDRVDPRVKQITVRQLLYHSGGWDRTKSGDPNGFSDRVAERMRVPMPVSPRQLTRFMLGRPLDFDPGAESHYSNFGYILLGLIIELGMGWDEVRKTPTGVSFRKNGGLLGVHSYIEHRADGVDWALFWNGGRQADEANGPAPVQFVRRLDQALTEINNWPSVDLFERREQGVARK